MTNFNTNQTRNLYVALAKDAAVDTNGDITLKSTAGGELFFSYRNGDGQLTRSDLIYPKNVVSLKLTKYADMCRKLMKHTVAVDTSVVTLSELKGKTINCVVKFRELFDYDPANSLSIVASVVGNNTNTASAAAFHKDLAIAIAKALPKGDGFPLLHVFSNGSEVTKTTAAADVTGSATGVVLVEGPQKYVRGKLNGEPVPFSVSFRLADGNVGDIAWGTDTVAVSDVTGFEVIPANHVLADLEYFALGERGDVYRGNYWPNNYEPTYLINEKTGEYNMLSIEYYWAGGAENVQKSPRLIQVVAPATVSNDIASALYAEVAAACDPTSGNSADIADIKTRLAAVEEASASNGTEATPGQE